MSSSRGCKVRGLPVNGGNGKCFSVSEVEPEVTYKAVKQNTALRGGATHVTR